MNKIENLIIEKRKKKMIERNPKPLIPKKSMEEIFPEIETIETIQVIHPSFKSGNISLYELICLNIIINIVNPIHILEFGTFNGRTTLNFAANAPTAKIKTVDLPLEDIEKTKLPLEQKQNYDDMDELGFIGHPKLFNEAKYQILSTNIKQIWMDTAEFEHSKYYFRGYDFIFIDASHSFEYCFKDAQTALNVIQHRPNSSIIFHDYDGWPGVTEALNKIYSTILLEKMYHIDGTSMVIIKF
jgi:hypothetical protein